jgi:hypothetical protein
MNEKKQMYFITMLFVLNPGKGNLSYLTGVKVFFKYGRIHLDINAKEYNLHPLVLGRKNFLFP